MKSMLLLRRYSKSNGHREHGLVKNVPLVSYQFQLLFLIHLHDNELIHNIFEILKIYIQYVTQYIFNVIYEYI